MWVNDFALATLVPFGITPFENTADRSRQAEEINPAAQPTSPTVSPAAQPIVSPATKPIVSPATQLAFVSPAAAHPTVSPALSAAQPTVSPRDGQAQGASKGWLKS